MRWRPEEPKIEETDGFEKTDIFGYAEFGGWLADVLAESEDAPVLLVDGDWGSGKSVFARQWAGLLRQQGNAVLYFDAFASDYQDDAFPALAEAVYGFAEELGVGEPDRQAFSGKAARAAALALAKGLGRQVPGVDVTALVEEVGESLHVDASRLKRWIEEAGARKRAVEEFRVALERLAIAAAQLATRRTRSVGAPADEADADPEGGKAPFRRLVFIVDELDRCKPDFALSVLERIKHVFGVRGVAFVLVTNFAELQQSVRRAYGDVGARKYLEKFYDLRFRLPKCEPPGGQRSKREVYAQRLWERLAPARIGNRWHDVNAFCSLADLERLSLRNMEHVMRNIVVLAAWRGGAYFGGLLPTGVLVSVVRVAKPALFRRLLQGEALEGEDDVEAMKIASLWPRESFAPPEPGVRGRQRMEQSIREDRASELSSNWSLQRAAQLLAAFNV